MPLLVVVPGLVGGVTRSQGNGSVVKFEAWVEGAFEGLCN